MNDHELDALVAAAARPPADRLASALATAPLTDLRETILTTDATAVAVLDEPAGPDAPAGGPLDPAFRAAPRRLPRAYLVAAVLALIVLLAGSIVLDRLQAGDPDAPAPTESWSEEAMRVAESVPTLLLAPGGWTVADAVELTPERGELVFTGGDEAEEVVLHWRPAAEHVGFVDDRAHSADGPAEPITVAGRDGVLFQYAGGSPNSTVLWRDGDHAFELRATVGRATMRQLAAEVVEVDADTWLAALPPDVVRSEDRAAVVAGMVEDIPLPPGVDLAALQEGDMAGDRYGLGMEVTQAITCGWATAWEAATAAGDTAGADRAEQAMATARDWAILREMEESGGWPEYIHGWADAIASGSGVGPNGRPVGSFCTNR